MDQQDISQTIRLVDSFPECMDFILLYFILNSKLTSYGIGRFVFESVSPIKWILREQHFIFLIVSQNNLNLNKC